MSSKYHKIQTLFKREKEKPCNIIVGQYTLPEFDYLKNNKWAWTEKIDGTNIRVNWDGKEVTFGGRTDNAQIPATLVNKLKELFPADKMANAFPTLEDGNSVTLYGEGYGKGIQKGGVYIKDGVNFILFDIRIGHWWLTREAKEEIADVLGIQIVPLLYKCNIADAITIARTGFKSRIAQDGTYIAEGLVGTPEVDLFARNGMRIITKLKYKDFAFERNAQ